MIPPALAATIKLSTPILAAEAIDTVIGAGGEALRVGGFAATLFAAFRIVTGAQRDATATYKAIAETTEERHEHDRAAWAAEREALLEENQRLRTQLNTPTAPPAPDPGPST